MLYNLFEATIEPGKGNIAEAYYMSLLPKVKGIDGFIEDTFLGSVHNAELAVNISQWKDADALTRWRNEGNHLTAQSKGPGIYQSYRIRIGHTVEGSNASGSARQWVVLYYRDFFDGKPADDITTLLPADAATAKEDLLDSVVYQATRIVWIAGWRSRDAAEKFAKALTRVDGDTLYTLAIERDYTKTDRNEAPSQEAGGVAREKL